MSDTYSSLLVHCVFSTYERRPTIPRDIQPKLWAYMGGIARAHKMKALAVGGTQDHVHILLSLSTTMTVAKAIQLIKANSSKGVNEHPRQSAFAWQKSHGAFTIGVSQARDTVRYINNQERHHAKMTFDQELAAILRRHGIVPVLG